MMTAEIRARCVQGWLIVSQDTITIERPGPYFPLRETLYRSQLSGIDSAVAIPSFFGFGGGTNLVFYGQDGTRLHANLVRPNVARQIVSLLRPGQG